MTVDGSTALVCITIAVSSKHKILCEDNASGLRKCTCSNGINNVCGQCHVTDTTVVIVTLDRGWAGREG